MTEKTEAANVSANVTTVMLPAYSVPCMRCEAVIVTQCECAPATADKLRAHAHLAKCKPTYRDDGGALPNRCPKCTAPAWLEAPAWRHGEGKSAETLRRRRVAAREAREARAKAKERAK